MITMVGAYLLLGGTLDTAYVLVLFLLVGTRMYLTR